VISEVVEIEADEEDLDDESEAVRDGGGARQALNPEPHASGEDSAAARVAKGRAGEAEGDGARTPLPPTARRIGAGAQPGLAAAPPPRAERRVELATFLGSWTDPEGNLVQVGWASHAACGSAGEAVSLDVRLIPRGDSKKPIPIKVTQEDGEGFSCGRFRLDTEKSHPDRLVWASPRSASKTSVWERMGPPPVRLGAAPPPAGAPEGSRRGGRAAGAAAAAGAPVSKAATAAAAAAAATGPKALGAARPAAVQVAGAGAAAAPLEGVRSLGARAKVKPSRPPSLAAEASPEAPHPSSEIELATFLGGWVDSMGHAVQVDWARPNCGSDSSSSSSSSSSQLDVKLIRPQGGRDPIRLKVSQQDDGLFTCGHFSLDVAKSSAARIVWADKFNPAKTSVWQRQNGAAPPTGQAVPSGLKRSWSLDSAPSPASKLSRLGSSPCGGAQPAPNGGLASGPAGGQPPRPLPAALRSVPPGAKDAEGRLYDLQAVVVNFADVGTSYAKSVLAKSPQLGAHDFDWEGVRRCVRYMRAEREMQIYGVLPEDFQGEDSGSGHRCGLPFDIQLMCECVEEALPSPPSGEEGAAREMTVERAYERNCLYVDSGNGAAPLACHARCQAWLARCRDLLHLRYFFDSTLGTFDVFDGNVGPPTLARMNSFG